MHDAIQQGPKRGHENTAQTVMEDARPTGLASTLQEVLLVLAATMAVAIGTAQQGAAIVNLTFIASDLDMTTAEISWINAGPALTSGAFLLLFGRAADLFGRKSLFVGSMLLFALTCVGAGFSTSGIMLDALSGLMGLFSASAVPPAQGILGVIYERPSKRKNMAMACFSAGNPLGFAFGMVFSGIATRLFNWRAGFWLLAIIYLTFSVIAFFVVPPERRERAALSMETIRKFDIVGTLLTTVGVGAFTGALSIAGEAPDGWRTSYIIVLLIVGIALMAAFVFWELHYDHPLVPMSIWRDRNLSLLIVILLLGFLAFASSYFWLSLYFQEVWHASSVGVAIYLIPMAVCGVVVNIIAAVMMHRVSNKLLMGICTLAYVVAFTLEALHKSSFSYWALIFPALCLTVIGADIQFNVTNIYIMSALPLEQQSIAGGIMQTATKLGTAIAFGFSTAIFTAVKNSPASSGYYKGDPVEPYAATWWCSAGITGLSLALVPFLTLKTQGGKERTISSASEDSLSEELSIDEEKKGGARVVLRVLEKEDV